MSRSDIHLLKSVNHRVLFVSYFENLPVFSSSQLLQHLVVPKTTALSHMAVHFILLSSYNIKTFKLSKSFTKLAIRHTH